MTEQLLSNLRDTIELNALKSTLEYLRLDADDLLTRYFSKLKARNINNVFEIETFLSVSNKMVTATIKTSSGPVGLQIYSLPKNSGSYEIRLVDVVQNSIEVLFIMQSSALIETAEPSD